jgi:hypothetical protein
MMCRITQFFFAKSFLIGTVRKVYSRTHSSIFFESVHSFLNYQIWGMFYGTILKSYISYFGKFS